MRKYMGSWDDKTPAPHVTRPWLPDDEGSGRPMETYATLLQSRKRANRITSSMAAAKRVLKMIEGGMR